MALTAIKGLAGLVALVLLVVTGLFVDFAVTTFSMRQRDVKTDAIVVLAGGRGRIEEGTRLYRENRAQWLLLVGVDPLVRKGELFHENPGEKKGDGVILEKVSRNTLENALYARELILQKQITSVRLITSRYHMKRAMLIFRNMLPKDIAIYPHPVDSKNLKGEWWSHRGSFRLLSTEFYKYCVFRIFFQFSSGELRPVISSQPAFQPVK